MHLRSSLAFVLAVPLLASCGLDYATDQVYTPSVGVSNQEERVDVLSALVVATQADSGTFIATFSNNSGTEPATFDSLMGASGTTVTAETFQPMDIAPAGQLSLSAEGGVPLTGDFEAGDFIPVTVGFANGDQVVMQIPVVRNCGNYEGLDVSEPGSGAEAYSCEYPEPVEAH